MREKKSNVSVTIIVFFLVMSYIILFATQHWITIKNPIIQFSNVTIYKDTMRGIISQFQLLVSILMVLQRKRVGYIMAITFNIISFFTALIYVISSNDISPIPGVVTYLAILIVVILIYRYKKIECDRMKKIEDQKQEIEKFAYLDDLTGVMNRRKFMQSLKDSIDRCKNSHEKLLVVFVDIDNFKTINDSMGHHVGDNVLREITKRLGKKLNRFDIIGRLGGDELGLLCERSYDREEFRIYMEQIKDSIIEPYVFDDEQLFVTASFGAAIYPKCAGDPEELLKKADEAMYYSKNKGKNEITFYCEMEELKKSN